MHGRFVGSFALLAAVVTGWAAFTFGQVPQPPAAPTKPTTTKGPSPEQLEQQLRRMVFSSDGNDAADVTPLAKLKPIQRQFFLAARRGADWLQRVNQPNGRFLAGFSPSLGVGLEGDHYLHQVGAAVALARSARYFNDKSSAVVARAAVQALLLDTETDPKNPQILFPAAPSFLVNRLGAAGLLVLAINELPSPDSKLLKQSDELCNYIRSQQRPDGSLCYADPTPESKPGAEEPAGINFYPGAALYGLMRSQQHLPAAWKIEVVRKALKYYQPWWRSHKNMEFVPLQTAAYAEAYLATKDLAFLDFVHEMNEWLCTLQYRQLDPQRPLWLGGFLAFANGKASPRTPHAGSAEFAESLADACRVARQAGDVTRFQRYHDALERCLQFLTTLQYTEANCQHFAEWYRGRLLGAVHGSHQDGDLHLQHTQHAVCALVQYLRYVEDVPEGLATASAR
jgi:hypothetical protein